MPVSIGDRSTIVAEKCDKKPIGDRIRPRFSIIEAIAKRISSRFTISTCPGAFSVQCDAQNGDTFDLTRSRKCWHGLRCGGKLCQSNVSRLLTPLTAGNMQCR